MGKFHMTEKLCFALRNVLSVHERTKACVKNNGNPSTVGFNPHLSFYVSNKKHCSFHMALL